MGEPRGPALPSGCRSLRRSGREQGWGLSACHRHASPCYCLARGVQTICNIPHLKHHRKRELCGYVSTFTSVLVFHSGAGAQEVVRDGKEQLWFRSSEAKGSEPLRPPGRRNPVPIEGKRLSSVYLVRVRSPERCHMGPCALAPLCASCSACA